MKRNALMVAVIGVGLGVGAGLWRLPAGSARVDQAAGAAIGAIAAELAAGLREDAAATRARAVTLAELPAVRAAVADGAPGPVLRARAGESITVARGPVVLVQAGAALPVALDRPGSQLAVVGSTLVLGEVVTIAGGGVLAVARAVDLGPAATRLAALGIAARLEVGTASVTLTPATAGTAETDTLSLADLPGALPVRLHVARPVVVGGRGWSRLAGAACALAGLIAGGLLARRRGRAVLPVAPAAPVTLAAPVAPVAVAPSYRVVRSLGVGGMAEVFLAEAVSETGFARPVALKVLHAELTGHAKVVAHFLDEARLAACLSHPNLVAVHDLGRQGDRFFIALELVDGQDLYQLLARARAAGRPLPVAVALAILDQVCAGLHAAHTGIGRDGRPLQLVHRDVKTANVLVARSGNVKVTDFGIAKADQQQHETSYGETKGTLATMAPEQRLGHAVDRRVDVYGAGIIAYELLTGAAVNLDLARLMPLGRVGWPHMPAPSQLRPELPAELDAIVLRALAYAPEDRLGSCAELAEACAAVAARHGLRASARAIAAWLAGEDAAGQSMAA